MLLPISGGRNQLCSGTGSVTSGNTRSTRLLCAASVVCVYFPGAAADITSALRFHAAAYSVFYKRIAHRALMQPAASTSCSAIQKGKWSAVSPTALQKQKEAQAACEVKAQTTSLIVQTLMQISSGIVSFTVEPACCIFSNRTLMAFVWYETVSYLARFWRTN